MRRTTKRIAQAMGAEYVGRLPHVGGGAFAAARLPALVTALKRQLQPGRGLRPGRPTDSAWVLHPKVPMSAATKRMLVRLANQMSTEERRVSAMQVAAKILEAAIAELTTKD
jgi:hypothetical protein